MVSRSEGRELTANGMAAGTATDDDWGAAWGVVDDEEEPAEAKDTSHQTQEEDDGADAWGWDDDDQAVDGRKEPPEEPQRSGDDEDDAADAWGWGDEDATEQTQQAEPQPQPPKTQTKKTKPASAEPDESREMVLKETYHISSMPEPVLDLIMSILEDGAALTQPE